MHIYDALLTNSLKRELKKIKKWACAHTLRQGKDQTSFKMKVCMQSYPRFKAYREQGNSSFHHMSIKPQMHSQKQQQNPRNKQKQE